MFGCVVAGRLIQTNLHQVDDTHAIFELPSASTINHICVFLLGTVPFPDTYGATVHFHWPGKGFQLLGALSNDKPSAIFRLRGVFSTQTSLTHAAFQVPSVSANLDASFEGDVNAILGISVEPLAAIQAQLATLPSALARPAASSALSEPTALAEKIVKHLFNYLSSFAAGGTSSTGLSTDNYVQMRTITRWYETFISKVRAGGTGFLDKDQ
ncbi:hypothetical protein EW145_g1828 [Phellinidium pouzarii]|uniref:Uncharacterized protein n=1 Tax=Phellinidium pouzarii TaxID=167371 RepID=A0A4S4LD30_9AGAM|nr:hypothetical protein EW145_g1828 [Phellinidium pouzarii]